MPSYGPEVLGPPPRDPAQQFWDPEIQTMDPEQLRDLQAERLRALVQKILDTPVPLFARKLAEAGISSGQDLKSVDDISRIPLTVKQDLRDSESEHPPWGDYRFTDPRKAVRLGTSTGTTGTPTISLWTRRDLWIEYE
jgi:phenylacetate-CoA ligase